jgi:DNA-3-methyladenine glycosylase II
LNSVSGELTPKPPFDFAKTLRYPGAARPIHNEPPHTGESFRKALCLDGQMFVFSVSSRGTIDEPELAFEIVSDEPITPELKAVIEGRIGFFLSVDDDLQPFYDIARTDPYFEPIVDGLYGYHQVKFLTPFECACWAILAQRNTMPAALTLKQRLIDRYGGELEVDGVTYQAFPEPVQIVSSEPDELFYLLPNLRRAEYLVEAAKAFLELDEEFLTTADYEKARRWLKGIRGIGNWSAPFILLRGFGRTERIPPNEWRIVDAASKIYAGGGELSEDEVHRLGAKYGRWQGYWAHYLRAAFDQQFRPV